MKRLFARFLNLWLAFIALACLASAATIVGCATQGGGNLDPVMAVLAPKLKVLDFDAKTYIDSAAACNAEAAKDYNAAMLVCANPASLVAEVNATPAGAFITAQNATLATQAITAKCTIDGFLPGMAATIQQTTCPVAPTPAPAG